MLEYQYSLDIEINTGGNKIDLNKFKEDLENSQIEPSFSFCISENISKDPKGNVVIFFDSWETDDDHSEGIEEFIDFLEDFEDLISFGSSIEIIDRPTFTKKNWVFEPEGWNFYEETDSSFGFNYGDDTEEF